MLTLAKRSTLVLPYVPQQRSLLQACVSQCHSGCPTGILPEHQPPDVLLTEHCKMGNRKQISPPTFKLPIQHDIIYHIWSQAEGSKASIAEAKEITTVGEGIILEMDMDVFPLPLVYSA